MALLGKGALLNWGGVLSKHDLDYNLWHSIEHMPERMSVKGFLRAFRSVGLKGTNDNDKYFMMYDVKNKDFLSSKQYLNRLNNPTDWTSKILSKYIYPSRAVCEVIKTKSLTNGLSGFFVTIRYLSQNNDIENFYNISNEIMSKNGIFSIHCFQSDKEISLLKTKEKAIRSFQGNEDEIIDYAVVIECLNINKVKNFLLDYLKIKSDKKIKINYYQLQHVIELV
ncbi:hypothetical protein OA253_04030 [Alphaproteobacteria bacterium]|nr:hypothetical protein [Alphaproteobacteria bacterium]